MWSSDFLTKVTTMNPRDFLVSVLSHLDDQSSWETCLEEVQVARAVWESLHSNEPTIPHAAVVAEFEAKFAATLETVGDEHA